MLLPAPQLAHAAVHGPLAITRLRGRGCAWLAAYLAASAVVLGAVAWAVAAHEHDAAAWLASFLFKESWQPAGRFLLDRLVSAQERVILINATIALSLVAVQSLLFPLKAKLSATFEREAALTAGPSPPLPFWVEAAEEIKLFLFVLALQATIFWIGYPPDPLARGVAVALSFLVLVTSFAVDFLSPILQRHGLRYAEMVKALAVHPLLVIAFGVVFTLPPALVGRWAIHHPGFGPSTVIAITFAATVVSIAWAAVAGTWCGAQLLPDARAMRPPSRATRLVTLLLGAALLAWNGWRYGALGLSLHHKTAILKCDYGLDVASLGFERPTAAALAWGAARDQVGVAVHGDVTVRNPTARVVEVEKNRVEVRHHGVLVATTSLTPVRVEPAAEARQTIRFPLDVAPSVLLHPRTLLDGRAWSITLFLEVAPGFELPVYLVR